MNNKTFPPFLGLALLAAWLTNPAIGQAQRLPQPAPVHAAVEGTHSAAERFVEKAAAEVVARSLPQAMANSTIARCIERDGISFCLDPNTPPELADLLLAQLPTNIRPGRNPNYNNFTRWTSTVNNPSTGTLGDPITLTYSFIADGVTINRVGSYDSFNNIPSEVTGPSSLFATLNSQFGTVIPEVWKAKFRACFNRWSQVTGIRYIEVTDDGAAFPGSNGAALLRGDVRIGGHFLDGAGGILAYNNFANTNGQGDMVLDTADSWGNSANDYRFLRNVVMHEHGHGMGLAHTAPVDNTKIMEPFINTGFDGPQDDDIRGANRNYGDPLENNDTAATATPVSGMTVGSLFTNLLSLDSNADVDWFRIPLDAAYNLRIQALPVGGTYLLGNQGGPAPTSVNTLAIKALSIDVFAADGVTQLGTTTAALGGNAALDINVGLAGSQCYVRIRSATTTNNVQRYQLNILLLSYAGVYVDRAFAGVEQGTPSNPYRTVTAAINVAGANRNLIYIRQGNYGTDRPRVTKNVKFINWGNAGQARIGKP